MALRGNHGLGYVRLDWFTPHGLGTWGDERLIILGTDGYIEIPQSALTLRGTRKNRLLAAELFLKAQKNTKFVTLKD